PVLSCADAKAPALSDRTAARAAHTNLEPNLDVMSSSLVPHLHAGAGRPQAASCLSRPPFREHRRERLWVARWPAVIDRAMSLPQSWRAPDRLNEISARERHCIGQLEPTRDARSD